MTSFRTFKSISALVCPTGHRLSRAPPDPSRPRDRAKPVPHSSPINGCPRLEKRCQRQTQRAGGVERCSPADGLIDPRDRGGSQKHGNPNATQHQTVHARTHLLLCCCAAVHGWVGAWLKSHVTFSPHWCCSGSQKEYQVHVNSNY